MGPYGAPASAYREHALGRCGEGGRVTAYGNGVRLGDPGGTPGPVGGLWAQAARGMAGAAAGNAAGAAREPQGDAAGGTDLPRGRDPSTSGDPGAGRGQGTAEPEASAGAAGSSRPGEPACAACGASLVRRPWGWICLRCGFHPT